ncbi:hypothetical protein BHM03_00050272 [Ensete ventricosum]|nr:hypothetical protein BHM03_00050272 [Ensete ventricosum]
MRLGTRQECIRSSWRVSGACQDGARKFARRRPRLARRLSGVNHDGEKVLQIIHGPRIKLRHRAKDWTMRWELVGSSLGDSPKGSGSFLGTRRKITGGRP